MSTPREPARKEAAVRGRIGAYSRWAFTDDRLAATAPARNAFNSRFEKLVDPEGRLTPRERSLRAEWARKAYFTRLAYLSAKARRKRRDGRERRTRDNLR